MAAGVSARSAALYPDFSSSSDLSNPSHGLAQGNSGSSLHVTKLSSKWQVIRSKLSNIFFRKPSLKEKIISANPSFSATPARVPRTTESPLSASAKTVVDKENLGSGDRVASEARAQYPMLSLSALVWTPPYSPISDVSLKDSTSSPWLSKPTDEVCGISREELADLDVMLASVLSCPRPSAFKLVMKDGLPYEHTALFEILLKSTRSPTEFAKISGPFSLFIGQIMPSRVNEKGEEKPLCQYLEQCLLIGERAVEAATCCTILTSPYSTHPYKDSFSHQLRITFYRAILATLEDDCNAAFDETRSLPAFLMMLRNLEPMLKNFVKKDAPEGFKEVEPLRELLQAALANTEIEKLMKTSPQEALKELLRLLHEDLDRVREKYNSTWNVMKENGIEAFDAHVHDLLFSLELRWQGCYEIYQTLKQDTLPASIQPLGEGPAALRILLGELAPQRPLAIEHVLDSASCLIHALKDSPRNDLAIITTGQLLRHIQPCISEKEEDVVLRTRFLFLQAIHHNYLRKIIRL